MRPHAHLKEAGPNSRLRIPVLRTILWLLALTVLGLGVIPSLYLVKWATYGTENVGIFAPMATARWFSSLLSDPEWQASLFLSLILGLLTSLTGTLLLVWHLYVMRYVSLLLDSIAYALLLLVIAIPAVVYGLALRFAGGQLNLSELLLLFLGHLVLLLPVQFYVLESAQESVPSELLFAGSTLGASHWRNFTTVYLPLIRRALVTSIIVGFFFSFDEIIIATIVIDSPNVTVPRRLWDAIPRDMDPYPAVVACMLFVCCLGLFLPMYFYRRFKEAAR